MTDDAVAESGKLEISASIFRTIKKPSPRGAPVGGMSEGKAFGLTLHDYSALSYLPCTKTPFDFWIAGILLGYGAYHARSAIHS